MSKVWLGRDFLSMRESLNSYEDSTDQGAIAASNRSAQPTIIEKTRWRLRSFLGHRPRQSHSVIDGEPVVVAGMFQTGNGVGGSARHCYDALKASGVNAQAVCTSDWLGQVDCATEIPLAPMPRTKTGVLILHANAPETEFLLFRLGLSRNQMWRVIGYWAWELPSLPPVWAKTSKHLSEIWVPSRFVRSAVEAEVDCPVRVVPPRIHMMMGERQQLETRDANLSCLVMADGRSSFTRKNIETAVELFRGAFPENDLSKTLTIKLRNLDEFGSFRSRLDALVQEDPRIKLLDATLTLSDLKRFIASHDVLLSCHRSEGFGLHLAEAMALGLCVIATGWSGNTDFMHEDNSILLPYQLLPVHDPDNIYQPSQIDVWAEVDLQLSIDILRRIATAPDKRRALGQSARESVARQLHGGQFKEGLFCDERADG